MISLTETEEKEILSYYGSYVIDEQQNIESDWVSRKFPSSGRVVRCVEKDNYVIIKQVFDPSL